MKENRSRSQRDRESELSMDHPQSQRRLSEISHLFLSDVRARQTGNAPRPTRKPPGTFSGDVSIDLTPEEFEQVFAEQTESHDSEPATAFKPVRAVVAHHLGEQMGQAVRDLAGVLCGPGKRAGLIFADASEVRVCCVEHNSDDQPVADGFPIEPIDGVRLRQTITELNQDIDQWLVVLPDTRCAESRAILKQIHSWTLLTRTDHDTVVSSYRTIKGICEFARPELSIAVLDAENETELNKTFHKLSSVCDQFLNVKATLHGAIPGQSGLAEHVVLHASASHSRSDLATAPQWQLLCELVTNAPASPTPYVVIPSPRPAPAPVMPVVETPVMQTPHIEPAPMIPVAAPAMTDDGFTNIIDLPSADATPGAIIQAVVRGGGDLIESPVKAPACPDAVIAVSRDHRLVMLGVSRQGLTDLRNIATAYRWMVENRALIAMAIPQFSLDAHALPKLEVLVDHADASADVLQPLLASGNVTIRAYRKLRWGGKTGLLLEAA